MAGLLPRTKVCTVLAAGLTAAVMLAAAPSSTFAQSTPDGAAEVAFWNSVKDTRNPAELRAYLDKYSNGTFAALARIRLQELERATTPAPPRPEPRTDVRVPVTDSASIREVQLKLYNLNYKLRNFNGELNTETMQAIRDWQQNVGLPTTGTVTSAELERLRNARISSTWGALAYAARGASGAVWNRSSRQDAERDAIAECRRRGGGKDCASSPLTAVDSGCGAMSHYTGRSGSTRHFGGYAAIRPNLAQAIESADSQCRQSARVPRNCSIRMSFCADGSHKR